MGNERDDSVWAGIFAIALVVALGVLFCGSSLAAEAVMADKKSPEQVAWEKKLTPAELKQPGFAYVKEDPALPRVLIIGDSISIGYTVAVRDLLKGKANVLRIPTNGGPTSKGVESLEEWLGTGKWDVIHFNWGLHDVKRMKDGKMDSSANWQVSAEQYEKNLDALTQRLLKTKAALIWASTTPVPEGASGRIAGDEVKVNEIAAKIMKKYDVPIDDLHGYVAPHLKEYQLPKNVHYTEAGYAFLAKQVAAQIGTALEKRK